MEGRGDLDAAPTVPAVEEPVCPDRPTCGDEFFDSEEAVSGLKSYGEGLVTLWYQEDYRDDTVVISRVQHLGPDAGPGDG